LATTRPQALTAGRSIVCQEKDRDRDGRMVAICGASGVHLGAILVREGSLRRARTARVVVSHMLGSLDQLLDLHHGPDLYPLTFIKEDPAVSGVKTRALRVGAQSRGGELTALWLQR
jgi:hypothetical protein